MSSEEVDQARLTVTLLGTSSVSKLADPAPLELLENAVGCLKSRPDGPEREVRGWEAPEESRWEVLGMGRVDSLDRLFVMFVVVGFWNACILSETDKMVLSPRD